VQHGEKFWLLCRRRGPRSRTEIIALIGLVAIALGLTPKLDFVIFAIAQAQRTDSNSTEAEQS